MISSDGAISKTRVGLGLAPAGNSLAARVSWLTFAKTVGFAFSIALPLLLVRRMDREQFGLYKQAFLLVTTAMTLLPMGVGMSAFYFLARETTRRAAIVWNILLFYVVVGGLTCAALVINPSMLTLIFHDSRLASYGAWIGVTILFWIVGSFLDLVPVANDEIRLASAFIVGIQASRAIVFLYAALLFGTLRSLLAAAIIHGLVQTVVLLGYLHSRFPGFWRALDWRMLREQLSYALPLGAAAMLMIAQTDLHNYFVSNRFGPALFAIYSVGTLQLPLIGLIWEATNSVLITRVSALEKVNEHREIVLLLTRAASKLAAFYFPVYAFLMVTGREFISVLFTARFRDAWPIFAVNLTLLPLGVILLDPLYRAFERERYLLLRVRLILAAALTAALWLFTSRIGAMGAISVVVFAAILERAVMAIHFGRLLGVTRRDWRLLADLGKLAMAASIAGAAAAVTRLSLLPLPPLVLLAGCGIVFAIVYLTIVVGCLRVALPLPSRSRATSAAVSSR